jgi:hypothetical protein
VSVETRVIAKRIIEIATYNRAGDPLQLADEAMRVSA